MKGSCHCGAVTVEVPGRPAFLNACNCSLCMKLGTLWGYLPRSSVQISGETRRYVRADAERPELGVHFCPQCGATTNWSWLSDDAPDRMAVNMRLFDPAELAGIEVRYGNRRDHERADPQPQYRGPSTFQATGALA